MAQRVLIDCDRCEDQATGEHLGPFDLGGGTRMIDMCEKCQRNVGLPVLESLLMEFGAPLAVGRTEATARRPVKRDGGENRTDVKPPSMAPVACPLCDTTSVGRETAIKHVMAAHGATRVEASHIVRPAGAAETCSKCGMLCSAGSGRKLHEMGCAGAA